MGGKPDRMSLKYKKEEEETRLEVRIIASVSILSVSCLRRRGKIFHA